MKPNKYAKFFAILNQANANGLAITKEEAVKVYTNGRTISLSSLSIQELAGLEAQLASTVSQRRLNISAGGNSRVLVQVPGSKKAIDPTQDKMRKAIISQFRAIGHTAQDAKAWAEKYGVAGKKKKFNDYDEQELYVLIRNAEKVKEDFTQSLNRLQK